MSKSEPEPHLSKVTGKEFIRRAFASEQACLEANLRSSDRIVHDGDRGEVNEQYFIEVLRHYLPNRYTVDKASVIDSAGQTSDSIDVVVFDRQYSPALLDSDKHRYVPVESVYAVFECKPTVDKGYLEYAGKKAASVRGLSRTASMAFPTATGTGKGEPNQIIAGILAVDVDWADGFGEAFKTNLQALTGDESLECGLAVSGATFDNFDDELSVVEGENSLVYFLFRFLAKLQSLGTSPAIDWQAYANQLVTEED